MKDIIKRSGLLPYALVIAILIVGLAGLTMLDNARAAGGGDGPGNITAKAYTAGVTKGTFVSLQAAGVIQPATAASDNIVGICRRTAAANQLTSYAPVGSQTTVTNGEVIAVGDLLTCDPNGEAIVVDASQALSQRITAIATTAAPDANTTSVDCIVVAGYTQGFDASMTAVTGATSPSVNDSGKTYNVTATAVITLPSVAAGVTYTFICDGPDGTVEITLSPAQADKIQGKGAAGVADKDRVNTLATAKRGDYITVTGGAATIWSIVRESGTWAAEG